MAERKLIKILLGMRRGGYRHDYVESIDIEIPYEIDEVELKARLRDMGYIDSDYKAYRTTKLLLCGVNDFSERQEEICVGKSRMLEEIGIKDNSCILIIPGQRERRDYYDRWSDARVLYGCPIAESVKDSISEAEGYGLCDSRLEESIIAPNK